MYVGCPELSRPKLILSSRYLTYRIRNYFEATSNCASFNRLGYPKSREKTNLAAIPLNPTVKTRHLAATCWLHTNPGDTINASHMESTMVQLSSLEFLPPTGDASGRVIPPTIVAVRSHLPVPMSHYAQDVYTTVDRWEVSEKPQAVHPAFEQLSSRRNSIGSQPGVCSD